MSKPKCMITVDVEALHKRAPSEHINTLIYGKIGGKEYGIGKMMDIADRHGVKMSFFVDFAECELYGDDMLEVGRYILSRGHDMQVHCHSELLEKVVGKPKYVDDCDNYFLWVDDYGYSKKMADYVTAKYRECCQKQPLAYRGGEYRIGKGMIKALKENGYTADCSYNYTSPNLLNPTKQFYFENGIAEIPISFLQNGKPMNFNNNALVPNKRDDFDKSVDAYFKYIDDYISFYGETSIITLMMHSWSFLIDANHSKETGHYDLPNDLLVEFYDCLLEKMKDKVDFVTVTQAVELMKTQNPKIMSEDSVLSVNPALSAENLVAMCNFIKEKLNGRKLAFWGKGKVETTVFKKVKIFGELAPDFYISRAAKSMPLWRGKPVYDISDVQISPKTHCVFVITLPEFTEIRESLQQMGFKEYEDYFDIFKLVPGIKKEFTCPICGGHDFEDYNSRIKLAYGVRLCSKCHSLERTRTLVDLLNNNVHIDFANEKILHILPSVPERTYLKDKGANVTTLDVRPECRVDIVADICNMPQVESNSFDTVLACCILNHVYDDGKALDEVSRVLKKGGRALIWVTGSGSLKNKYFDDPTQWYGKEAFDKYKVGTFRYYGETDFTQTLKQHFTKVNCYEKFDDVTATAVKWYECIK